MAPLEISKLPPGDHIVEDAEQYQLVVHRSEAGWTEEIVWKPGYAPEPPPARIDDTHSLALTLLDELNELRAKVGLDPKTKDELLTATKEKSAEVATEAKV